MSRWTNNFDNHAFQTSWKQLLDLNHEVVADNIAISTDVEEVARYRKTVSYIDNLIQACDPELVPESTWANFSSQAQACLTQVRSYQQTRTIGHLQNANQSLDNLISYVAPFVKDGKSAARASNAAFKEFRASINESLSTQADEIERIVSEAQNKLDKIEAQANQSEKFYQSFKEFYEDTFNEDGIETRINEALAAAEKNNGKISSLHDEIFEGTSGRESIENAINSYLEEAKDNTEKIDTLLSNNEKKLKELQRLYSSVYGIEDSEGNKSGGLQREISDRIKDLDSFKSKHEVQYNAYVKQIESLVSGATSAGLARSYYILRKSFNGKIRSYSLLFYTAIAFLFLVSFATLIKEIGYSKNSIVFSLVDVTNYNVLLPNFLYKLPVVLPILWLAIFASRRRSEADRLQQEYAHKEAIAKSYENFKKQIQELGESDPELMKKLLGAAIDAISENASQTLDTKYKESTPLHELIEKVAPDLEKLSKLLPFKNGG